MLRNVFLTSFLVSFFLLSSTVNAAVSDSSAAAPAYDLGTVSVTAPAFNHPETITGSPDGECFFETLPATGRSTLSEALDGQMAMHLRVSGGAGHITGLSSGGLSGNKILIVKDGMPINDPFTGSPDIGDFSTFQFEKAEFWEGNRATLWGSNSVGGTLRLTSRFPDSGRLRLFTDGMGGNGRGLETRLNTERAVFGVRVSSFKTPGFSAAEQKTGNTERDGFVSDNGFVAMNAELNARTNLYMSAESSKSTVELDGFDFVTGLPADNNDFRQIRLHSQFNLNLTRRCRDGELNLLHAFSHTGLTGIDESNPFNEYGLETSRQRQAVNRTLTRGKNRFLAEVSRLETRAESHGLFVRRETDVAAVLAMQTALSDGWSANITTRHDDPQNHKGVNTGNLSLDGVVGGFDVGLSYGRAFRMPALNERYYPNYGDPDLGAEHSTSAGISIGRKISGFGRLAVHANRYSVRDLIGTTATADPAYAWGIKAANLNRASIRSHRFSLSEVRVAGISCEGDLTLLDKAELRETGKQIPGMPVRQASLQLKKNFAALECSLQARWWGHTQENAENTKSAPASHDLSVFLRRSFKQCAAEIGVLNITDTDRQRVLGYTRPGRRLTLAFEAYF